MASLVPESSATSISFVPDFNAAIDTALALLQPPNKKDQSHRFRTVPAPSEIVDRQKLSTWLLTRIVPAWQSAVHSLYAVLLEQEKVGDEACMSYFAALLCYGALSGRSPVGLPATVFVNDMPLQSLAHDTLWPAPSAPVVVPPHLASRLLYANPVCFLAVPFPSSVLTATSCASSSAVDRPSCVSCNMMAISWLTATDNNGSFFMSMNNCRASSDFIQESNSSSRLFTLSIACEGCEDMLLAVGTTSARKPRSTKGHDLVVTKRKKRDHSSATSTARSGTEETCPQDRTPLYSCNKILRAGVQVCLPGWGNTNNISRGRVDCAASQPSLQSPPRKLSRKAERKRMIDDACSSGVVCVARAVGHIVARVTSIQRSKDGSHNYVHAKILRGFVRPGYWRDPAAKKTEPAIFVPRGQRPGLLKFLGSKTFGVIR